MFFCTRNSSVDLTLPHYVSTIRYHWYSEQAQQAETENVLATTSIWCFSLCYPVGIVTLVRSSLRSQTL